VGTDTRIRFASTHVVRRPTLSSAWTSNPARTYAARVDEALVRRARGGDRAAMEELLASVAPSIQRFAMRMCRNPADADDVLQDALLSIATHLHEFEGRSSLPTWAFSLTRSACSRRRRGLKNQPAEQDEVLAGRPADAPGPEEVALSGEAREIVGHALDRLSDDHREVLLLRDVEGLTAPEAALALGLSVDALKSRLHRARAALRDELRPTFEAEAPPRAPGCPDVVRALSEKLEGDLDPSACAQMEKHVESCPACARTCDALKDALRACRSSSTPALTTEIRSSVRSALANWLSSRGR
jgi:RNA polymerase sigma-70 factor (ECF subfamily)